VLCPGVVTTEIHLIQGSDPSRFPAAIVSSPDAIVDASLAGLKLGEVICVPALEDMSLLANIQEDERKFFELSRTGAVAARYKQ